MAVLGLSVVGSAVTIRDDASFGGSSGLDAATAYAAQSQFASVGLLTGSGVGASGVLINSRWVLTAWHVAVGQTAGNMSFNIGGSSRSVSEIHLLAAASASFATVALDGTDLALLRLTDEVLGVSTASLYTGGSELNSVVSVAGFGGRGTGSSGANVGGGVRSAMRNTVDFYGTPGTNGGIGGTTTRTGVLLMDFDNPDGSTAVMGSATPVALEGNVAGGDSGGGLFIEQNGQFLLAGITSFRSTGGNSGYNSLSGFASVDFNAGWIESTINPVPEPMTLLALAGLGAMVARRRKKS